MGLTGRIVGEHIESKVQNAECRIMRLFGRTACLGLITLDQLSVFVVRHHYGNRFVIFGNEVRRTVFRGFDKFHKIILAF